MLAKFPPSHGETSSDYDLILHIGPHKTATTTIQRALAESGEYLRTQSWRFEPANHLDGGLHELAQRIRRGKLSSLHDLEGLVRNSADRLVLSSENFSLVRGDDVRLIHQALEGRQVRVVFYLRNPLERLPSYWTESVKHGLKKNLDEFMTERESNAERDYLSNTVLNLEPWIDAFGIQNVSVDVMDAMADPVSSFFANHLGVNWSGKSNRLNVALSDVRAEVLRKMPGTVSHLLTHDAFVRRMKRLEREISDVLEGTGKRFRRTWQGSLSAEPWRSLEKAIVCDLIPQKGSERIERLFFRREHKRSYIDPAIWEARTLGQRLNELSDYAHKFGSRS